MVDRALRRAMFPVNGFTAHHDIERGALDPPVMLSEVETTLSLFRFPFRQ
jgi:hypothetical protein